MAAVREPAPASLPSAVAQLPETTLAADLALPGEAPVELDPAIAPIQQEEQGMALAAAPEQQQRGVITLRELVVKRVKDRVGQKNEPKSLRDRLTLANMVNMAGRVTGMKLEAEETYNENGERTAFSVAARRFEITTSKGQSSSSLAPSSNK